MTEFRKATQKDLEVLWDKNISDYRGDPQWIAWKSEYIGYNRSGMGTTFAVIHNGRPVGEGTLLFSPECSAIRGRTALVDGCRTANINALRIRKKHEGKGYISALVRMMEQYAAEHGYTHLTIGVEARETRNLAIYLHWGYDELVTAEYEDGELVLYYAKNLNTTE